MVDTLKNTFFIRSLVLLAILLGTQLAPSSAAPPPSLAAPAAQSASPRSGPVDGFKLTVEYWAELEKLAGEVQATVLATANQASESYPANNTRYLTAFNTKLAEKYPGARFDGKNGTVPLPNHLVASFAQDLKVTKLTNVLPVVGRACSKIYYIQERKFECSTGNNFITGLINKASPGDCVFSEVKYTVFQDAVEKIFAAGPEIRTANTSVGVAVLNDAYQLSASTQGLRMDTFAEKFFLSDDIFNFVLRNAQAGYKQRHAAEFSAKDPSKLSTPAVLPGAPAADGKFWSVGPFFVGLFLVVLALLAALFYGFRWFFQQVRDNLNVENRVKA